MERSKDILKHRANLRVGSYKSRLLYFYAVFGVQSEQPKKVTIWTNAEIATIIGHHDPAMVYKIRYQLVSKGDLKKVPVGGGVYTYMAVNVINPPELSE